MLSGLTVYLEHHDALYTAGIFPALIRAVLNANNVPQVSSVTIPRGEHLCKDGMLSEQLEQKRCAVQVRVIALGSTADLLKDDRAKKAAIEDERFLPTLLQALQVTTPQLSAMKKTIYCISLMACL